MLSPTVKAVSNQFDAKSDADLLRNALMARSVDDEKILQLLCSRTSVQVRYGRPWV